ncbi:hypothetical protein F4703DRAFT_1897768 [Phycomyces blakesleeanus]
MKANTANILLWILCGLRCTQLSEAAYIKNLITNSLFDHLTDSDFGFPMPSAGKLERRQQGSGLTNIDIVSYFTKQQ